MGREKRCLSVVVLFGFDYCLLAFLEKNLTQVAKAMYFRVVMYDQITTKDTDSSNILEQFQLSVESNSGLH